MTDDEYSEILLTHGRRVANRAVLSTMSLASRELSDFHECYGPEADLPDHERCRTGLAATFDPCGLNLYYPPGAHHHHEWPSPEEVNGAEAGEATT